MKKAAELLTSARLSVAEIAELVGYMNQSKFASVFKNNSAYRHWNTGGQRIWKTDKNKAGICHLSAKSRPFLCLKTICKSVHLE